MSQVVLITGCSSGIGRDLSQRLTAAGYTVVATARKIESLEGLQAALKLPLDVTRPESVTQRTLSNPASPYRTLYQHFEQMAASMHQQGSEPGAVSKVVQQAIETARPKARYLVGVGLSGRLVMGLGSSAWDFAFRRMLKIAS